MIIQRLAFLLTCLFGIAPMLNAAVSERDFLATGDGLLTYDDVHGREWLDLNETLAFDRTTIMEAILTGGSLRGFSLATQDDFEGFAISAGVTFSELSHPGMSGEESEKFIDLVDWSFRAEGGVFVSLLISWGQIAAGITSDILFPAYEGVWANVFSFPGDPFVPGQLNRPLNSLGNGGFFFASASDLVDENGGPFWLYRTAVPEPTSITLLLLGVSLCSTRPANRR